MLFLIDATARVQVASFVAALIWVYTILIIAYIFSSMYFNVGGRLPYSRWSRAILDFLRDVCEPYLSFFRRFSPMVGILVLIVVGNVVVSLIHG
jgi:YggT family protein